VRPGGRLALAFFAGILVSIGLLKGLPTKSRTSTPTAADSVAEAASVTEPTANAAQESESGRTIASATRVPPIESRPADTIGLLLPAARAGDAAASCRLGIEYALCEGLERHGDRMIEQLSQQELMLAQSGNHSAEANRLATLQAGLIERRADCRALPPALRNDGTDWLARSAAAGHHEARLRYLRGESLGYLEGMDFSGDAPLALIGHPNAPAWMRDAPRIALMQVESGDPHALFLLRSAHESDRSAFEALIRDDPVERAALRLVEGEIWEYRTSDVLDALTDEQRREATARAAVLRPRFAGAARDNRTLARSALPGLAMLAASLPPGHLAPLCTR
jgi:hypothetical protein